MTLREVIFIEFGAYLALRIVYFLTYDGLAYQWLLPNDPTLLHTALRFLLAMTVASIAPILVRVLDMYAYYPKLARLSLWLGVLAALVGLTAGSDWFPRAGVLLSVIVLLLGGIGAIVALLHLKRNRPLGSLILLAMLTMLIGFVTSALASFGVSSGQFLDVYGKRPAIPPMKLRSFMPSA